jgi:LruC domain-containing protein
MVSLAALSVASSTAWSQETVIPDATTWHPGASSASVLAFEDQWPYLTDYDYNDVVVEVRWVFHWSGGRIHRALLTVDPIALGGAETNGLGVQLPPGTSKAGLVVRRRVGGDGATAPGSGWQEIALAADAAPTVVVASDLRALFDGEAGQLNVGVDGKDERTGSRVEVEFRWPIGVDLDTGAAPFDLYIFRRDLPSHEIHFPQYQGTLAMDPALFDAALNTRPPGGTKWYVNDRGIPAALDLKTTAVYPREAVRIETVFPDIVQFAAHGASGSFSAAPAAGAPSDPRVFYSNVSPTAQTRPKPGTRGLPTAPAITRYACTPGANQVGWQVLTTSACVVAGCVSGFSLDGGVCTAGTRSCSPPNAPANSGTETWTGSDWGACVASSCNSGYTVAAGACVQIPNNFVVIPAGTYTRGTGANWFQGSSTVTLSRAFFLKRTEATQGEWKALSGNLNPACFKTAGSTTTNCTNAGAVSNNDFAPVENVTWWSILGYLNALSAAAGLPACYSEPAGCTGLWQVGTRQCGSTANPTVNASSVYACAGYRLPTDAEWEVAARGGTATDTYAGDLSGTATDRALTNQPSDYTSYTLLKQIAYYAVNAGSRTRTVSGRPANQYGLSDMLGNVSEWTGDWWNGTRPSGLDPAGPLDSIGDGNWRIYRGCSWSDPASSCHVSSVLVNGGKNPDTRASDLGFRPARSVSP